MNFQRSAVVVNCNRGARDAGKPPQRCLDVGTEKEGMLALGLELNLRPSMSNLLFLSESLANKDMWKRETSRVDA